MITCSTAPIAPAFDAAVQLGEGRVEAAVEADQHRHAGGLRRRQAPGRPVASDRSIGFSQKIALPALAAAMTRSAWVSVEDAMITAPTAGSRSAVSASDDLGPVPRGERGGRRLMHIDDMGEARAAAGRQVAGVDGPDPAGTELREDEHGVSSEGPLVAPAIHP